MQTLMWEARAEAGQGEALLAWVREVLLTTFADETCHLYRSVRQEGDRIVVNVDYAGPAADPSILPVPPLELSARAPHGWVFERLDG